ncbi:hypothetical protein EV190_101762 [Actinorugispora endophytica]|uniref:Uncharacterized protein n=1 Tax=Actinorugispora endophytica TaxID=1605990 RepID=A0A4R6V4T3_9ACTN|nr:hypothetical protein EV190_101762 [Actinorugispora endophytica]
MDILPQGPVARVLAMGGFVGVAGALVLTLWQVGGLEKAPPPAPVPPGTEVRNELFALTVTGPRAVVADDDFETRVQVSGELTSLSKEPVRVSDLNSVFAPKLAPGDAALTTSSLRIRFDRSPERFVTYLQPEVTERVTLSWAAPEGAAAAEAEEVLLAVTGAAYEPGFTDQRLSWWTDNEVLQVVGLPIEQG